MTPEEISNAYEVVAADIRNRGANEAAKIGNSQSSLGLMAERVANPSGMTSGLANYTYDRTLRPTIDALSTSLVTQGKVNALSEYLRNELSKAKQNYQNAAASSGNNNGNSTLLNEITDREYTGREEEETAENTTKVVNGSSLLPWGNGTEGYIMIGTPGGGDGSPGQYVFQDRSGKTFYMDLPEGHEFVIDPVTGNLVTRQKK